MIYLPASSTSSSLSSLRFFLDLVLLLILLLWFFLTAQMLLLVLFCVRLALPFFYTFASALTSYFPSSSSSIHLLLELFVVHLSSFDHVRLPFPARSTVAPLLILFFSLHLLLIFARPFLPSSTSFSQSFHLALRPAIMPFAKMLKTMSTYVVLKSSTLRSFVPRSWGLAKIFSLSFYYFVEL